MKRYIRLKDGSVFDTAHAYIRKEEWMIESSLEILKDGHIHYYFTKDIIAESDNVLDLIDYDNDLFAYLNNIWSAKHLIDAVNFNKNDINKLYTKQGDNFILVWDKERGVI